ncbi:hypothetical protein COO60DRAFT_1126942 [Scenedesmus sp. NREL 46B-D3]|nr:hypothetical protein COO60DRAFT_1126942 [Scenedesmus sp. NREL 46B-D3]
MYDWLTTGVLLSVLESSPEERSDLWRMCRRTYLPRSALRKLFLLFLIQNIEMPSLAALAWILVGLLAASCSGRVMRQPLAALQNMPILVNFAELRPTLASIWIPSITPSQQKLQVPVSGLPGTPLQTDEMSRLTYTVTYKRRPAYILQGSFSVQTNPTFAGIDFGSPALQIQQPLVTLHQAGRTEQLPGGKVHCSSFMVADNSAVTCRFSVHIYSDSLPPAGTAQALIQIQAERRTCRPRQCSTTSLPYCHPTRGSRALISPLTSCLIPWARHRQQQLLQTTLSRESALCCPVA